MPLRQPKWTQKLQKFAVGILRLRGIGRKHLPSMKLSESTSQEKPTADGDDRQVTVTLSKRHWQLVMTIITNTCAAWSPTWVKWGNEVNEKIQIAIDPTYKPYTPPKKEGAVIVPQSSWTRAAIEREKQQHNFEEEDDEFDDDLDADDFAPFNESDLYDETDGYDGGLYDAWDGNGSFGDFWDDNMPDR